MLEFRPITEHEPGILASLLERSYAEIASADVRFLENERSKWLAFDTEAFGNPDTVGRCVFITCLNGTPIGFGSFDPRQGPEMGVIGHNCILPEYRGRGFGKAQIQEIVRRMRALGIRNAVVTTGESRLFAPAQRMYELCGFRETRRYVQSPDDGFRLIEYGRRL
jgi:GNAT superfamily N-acetyltransferase